MQGKKSSRCKPFGLTVCRFSYPAVVSGFNIYENQWSCIYAYVSSIIWFWQMVNWINLVPDYRKPWLDLHSTKTCLKRHSHVFISLKKDAFFGLPLFLMEMLASPSLTVPYTHFTWAVVTLYFFYRIIPCIMRMTILFYISSLLKINMFPCPCSYHLKFWQQYLS